MKRKKKSSKRKPKVATKTVVLEVETTASVALLKNRRTWDTYMRLLDGEARVRQVTVQVADATK